MSSGIPRSASFGAGTIWDTSVLTEFPSCTQKSECFHLYVSENRWFENLVPTWALKPFDPIADPPMFVKSDADDRTLDVCPDVDYLTVDLMRRIQTEFLGRHPLWRVVLAADEPSCSIVIYPEAIRFGNLPLNVDPEKALGEMVRHAVALRERRLRPDRAQVTFLQQRLPDAVRTIGDLSFFVVGVLDSKRRDYDRLVILLLIRGADDCAINMHCVGDELLSTSSGFGVDMTGNIISHIDVPDSAAFNVALWYVPADFRGPLTIMNRETGESDTYELKSENITHTMPSE
jgi:hypothetical protein